MATRRIRSTIPVALCWTQEWLEVRAISATQQCKMWIQEGISDRIHIVVCVQIKSMQALNSEIWKDLVDAENGGKLYLGADSTIISLGELVAVT